jgi:phosphopantothenoylcysteine synthetase/decarboxylase
VKGGVSAQLSGKAGSLEAPCGDVIPNSDVAQTSPCSLIQYNETASKKPEGVTMLNLKNALQELREERQRAQIEIEKLDQIISGIESLNGAGASHESGRPTRFISAASRRKMARAQKARWASVRNKSHAVAAGTAPAKRTLSASARKKIAAAQRARWAKVRAARKKAA